MEILTSLGKVSQNTAPSFLENLNLWCASFSSFCYPKVNENKMKPWKRHVLTTHTICKHSWLIRYETDMGPELSTAAADQNVAWICKQPGPNGFGTNFQEQNYLVRTRIWSGTMWISKPSHCSHWLAAFRYPHRTRANSGPDQIILVRCGYLNAAIAAIGWLRLDIHIVPEQILVRTK